MTTSPTVPNYKFAALSVVAPAGDRIRSGQKRLEIRRWAPDILPLRNLLIVQNQHRLSSAGRTEDLDGVAVALVDVVAVREWRPDEIESACATRWESGWLAWELANLRPVDFSPSVPVRLRIYDVSLAGLRCHMIRSPRIILFDWGDTLMSEDGPQDISMAYWPEVRPIDGAQKVLAALSGHYEIGVATNATVSKRADIRLALERAGLAPFIGEIFCRTELGCAKDDPRFWTQVLARLNLPREDVWMVGDSLEQDVLGPRASGITAIWLNWKNAAATVPADVPVIQRLMDLLEVLPIKRT